MNKIFEVYIYEFKELLSEAILEHKNTNDPIPALHKDSLSRVENCLKTPFQYVFGQDLYPTLYDKAAILMYMFVKNHPLSNGNKRMAFITMSFLLYKNGVELDMSNDKVYEFTKKIASSDSADKDLIINYIKKTLQPMTKAEKETKIADLKRRAQNKSLPASAVKKLEEMIAKLEAEPTKSEDKPPVFIPYKDEEIMHEPHNNEYFVGDTQFGSLEQAKAHIDKKDEKEKTVGQYKGLDIFDKGPKAKAKYRFYIRGKAIAPYTEGPIVANGETIEKLKMDYDSNNPESKSTKKAPAKKAKKAEPKVSPAKASDYDCDELIQKEKDRRAAQKKSAKKADATPDVKKVEKAAEKLGDRVQKKYKEGDLTKAEIKKIIEELQQQIKELQELLKTAK